MEEEMKKIIFPARFPEIHVNLALSSLNFSRAKVP